MPPLFSHSPRKGPQLDWKRKDTMIETPHKENEREEKKYHKHKHMNFGEINPLKSPAKDRLGIHQIRRGSSNSSLK